MTSETFYTTTSSISFTLLGLWWVVVQSRESWRLDPARRAMAWAVSLHFLLPGAMSVLSLVAPDVGLLWRATFASAGVMGMVGVGWFIRTLREEYDCPRLLKVIEWAALPVYAVITVIAVAPEIARAVVPALTPLQVEGVILAILIFFGVQAAWVLTIEPPRTPSAVSEPPGEAAHTTGVAPGGPGSGPAATGSPARDQSLNEPA